MADAIDGHGALWWEEDRYVFLSGPEGDYGWIIAAESTIGALLGRPPMDVWRAAAAQLAIDWPDGVHDFEGATPLGNLVGDLAVLARTLSYRIPIFER